MRYGSVCSGIEAATVAWHPLGWKPVFFAEIEPFPSAVLKHHYPEVPNLGDFTRIESGAIELLVGGTPCQSFSVAGLRGGLADDRGNLALEFLRLADRLRPRWVVWENVPGVLSSLSHDAPNPCEPPPPLDMEREGQEVVTGDEYNAEELHAFNCFLAGLSELGYGFAYRILDAQYFGVPQRRRRVFVVGCLGDWRRAAAVLFERHSLSGYPAPRRQAGKGLAAGTVPSLTASGRGVERTGESRGQDPVVVVPDVARCLSTSNERIDRETETFVAHSLRADGFDASEDGTGRGTPLIPVIAPPLMSGSSLPAGHNARSGHCKDSHIIAVQGMAVRRLTPRECARLQGFPDNYLDIIFRGKPAADGPKYKVLGNSMCTKVMRHLGERIQMVEDLGAMSKTTPLSGNEDLLRASGHSEDGL